jgi:CRP-like cAMP-binding protein
LIDDSHGGADMEKAMNRHQSVPRVSDPTSPVIGPFGVIDSFAMPVKCRRGEQIYDADRSVDSWYRVLAGAARRFTLRANGRRQIVDLLLPGDVFGFGVDGKHYFNAEAVGAGTVIAQYPCARIETRAATDSMIARELREMVKQETARLQTLILILGRITSEEKVGAFLVNLADRLSGGVPGPVSLPISRYDIADFLALSVETVSRALTSLKERRMITLTGPRMLNILDPDVLASGDFKAQPNADRFAWVPSVASNDTVRGAVRRAP